MPGKFNMAPRAQAIVLTDTEAATEAATVSDLYAREPQHGVQSTRARVSALITAELALRAERTGVSVITARPWQDSAARIDAALAG